MKCVPMSVQCIGSFGDDLTVVNAARVSTYKESLSLNDKDIKLIDYLAKHQHTSPFNHAFLSFRVKAPIFVARQLVKHKFLPWNEVSRRYVDDEPEFYLPTHWRKRADNIKQGSSDESVEDPSLGFREMKANLHLYNHVLGVGYCPEQARMFLPQNTMTEWIWSGTLGAWLEMLVLRLDKHTQKETREVAEKIGEVVKQHFPHSYKARIVWT